MSVVTQGMASAVDRETVGLMARACPEEPLAALLIRHTIEWTATYDHIVDGDVWTVDQVHHMVRVLLSDLPENAFYVRHFRTLNPIIQNAIHAWRYADSSPEYRIKVGDVIAELGCAVLQCVGGVNRLNEFGDTWRDQVCLLLKSSDEKD